MHLAGLVHLDIRLENDICYKKDHHGSHAVLIDLDRSKPANDEYEMEMSYGDPTMYTYTVTYCSAPLWRPHLSKGIQLLENIQRRATKFILNDFISDYKTRLTSLRLLPLTNSLI